MSSHKPHLHSPLGDFQMVGLKEIHVAVLNSDHVNHKTSDGKCSRCRQPIREDEVPLKLWCGVPNDMWVYCEICTPIVFTR